MHSAADAGRFSGAAIEALARFPIDAAEVTPVWMSENVTFRVTDARDGGAYALRLHRPGYHSLAELNAERQWTAALREAGVDAPAGVPARDGRWYVQVPTADAAGRRWAGMTRWTEGETLAQVLERDGAGAAPTHFRRLGALVATLHRQASAWTPPPGFVRRVLDRDGLVGEAPLWGRFWDSPRISPAERILIGATRDRIASALARLGGDPGLFGLIHADLHPHNVLADGDHLSVIDFDDAGFGWRPFDIAVAIFDPWGRPDFTDVAAAFLSGYRTVRDLDAGTEALIPMFLLIRGLSLIGWLDQRPEMDPAPYLDDAMPRLLAACEAFEPPV